MDVIDTGERKQPWEEDLYPWWLIQENGPHAKVGDRRQGVVTGNRENLGTVTVNRDGTILITLYKRAGTCLECGSEGMFAQSLDGIVPLNGPAREFLAVLRENFG